MFSVFFQVTVTLLAILHQCLSADININSQGNDTTECCTNSSVLCRSINFILKTCVPRTPPPITIFIQEQAFISGSDYIELPDNYVINVFPSDQTNDTALLSCDSVNSTLALRPNSSGIGNSIIRFNKVSFKNCGPKVPAAVLISGPLKAEFHSCVFANNFCSGLNARDTNLVIDSSRFLSNFANQTESFSVDFEFGVTSLGGGLGILFEKGGGYVVKINSSQFLLCETYINRDVSVISHDTGKKRLLSNYYASGGGINVIHAFNSSKNKVSIKKCHFERNNATYGGGLFLSFIHNTTANDLYLENCNVTKNFVSQTGGGVLFSSWDWAHNNTVIVKDCNLSYNDAMVGGAMKIIFNNKDPYDKDRGGIVRFEMHRVNMWQNTAMSGSALRLLQNLPIGRFSPVLPKLFNCTIQGHKPSRNSKEYPGAILSTRLGIEFEGENILASNIQGSAMYMSAGNIHIKGKLTLTQNKGQQGAAIFLADMSRIILYPESHIVIAENHADFRGGGLYVETVTLQETTYPYNPGCFLQYSEAKVPPSKWKVSIPTSF